jgi:putative aminopeptidase FrvX
MSQEVMAAISRTYELASYSTPELRSLFNDWLTEIERLVVEFVNKQKKVDPAAIAAHLHLQQGSVIFIVGKLAGDGKINMQACGTTSRDNAHRQRVKIKPLRRIK